MNESSLCTRADTRATVREIVIVAPWVLIVASMVVVCGDATGHVQPAFRASDAPSGAASSSNDIASTKASPERTDRGADGRQTIGTVERVAPAQETRPIVPCEEPPAGMACIGGGTFLRGTDDGPSNTRPAKAVWVSTYYMDIHEVTVTQYRACVDRGKCRRSGPRYTDFDHPDMPITGVSWYEARDFCAVMGKGLPTEAQWEKAARGPSGALHPWGSEPATCERAIIRDRSGRGCGKKKAFSKPETGRPWDVGSRPAGVYGLYDMVGNSWEWVQDWYASDWAACGESCRGADPKGPCDGASSCPGHGRKIVRGGSWYWPAEMATGAYRRAHVPDNRPFHHFGFRCAASVEQARALRAGGAG